MSADLSVRLGPLALDNPLMVASGTFGGVMDRVLDVHRLGAVVEKTVTKAPRKGNPERRIHETPSGMLNSIGLENHGIDGWIEKRWPEVRDYRCRLVLSVSGSTAEEYGELVGRLDALPRVDAFELNISCPNVSHGMDHATDPAMTEKVVRLSKAATRRPVFAKLTPNVTDIVRIATAAMEGGADGISAVNTLKGMAIDWRRRAPVIGATTGGLSGPAIRPVALRMVWEIASALPGVPIIGIGGISTADDVLEFLVAGASAVQIGTANFVDPQTATRILDELPEKLAGAKVARLRDLVGTCSVKAPSRS
jgi:dihydroorotate dehydrogenase (NAD+) catalytic subunit